MKIFIFGIGYMTNLILDYITEIPNSIEVLGFIDNNSEKWGGGFRGNYVFSPINLKETVFDNLIIFAFFLFNSFKGDFF